MLSGVTDQTLEGIAICLLWAVPRMGLRSKVAVSQQLRWLLPAYDTAIRCCVTLIN